MPRSVSLFERAAFTVLLALAGFLSAVALAGCGEGGTGGGGTLAGQVTRTSGTTSQSISVSRPTRTQTRGEQTVTETQPVTTTVATTREVEALPPVTVSQATTVVTVASGQATAAEGESAEETPGWVWVVVTAFCALVIGLIVLLLRRRSGGLSPAERRRLLDTTMASWTGAGWAIESQTGESAVVVRDGVRTLIAVDVAGHVTSGLLSAPADEYSR
jgi:hypothetical protein